jgi:hypothetical protein
MFPRHPEPQAKDPFLLRHPEPQAKDPFLLRHPEPQAKDPFFKFFFDRNRKAVGGDDDPRSHIDCSLTMGLSAESRESVLPRRNRKNLSRGGEERILRPLASE